MAIDPSIVAWWPGSAGAADVVGGNYGTLLNGATIAPGFVGDGFKFDGIDDQFVASTFGLPTGAADRTVELWVRVDAQVTSEAFIASYGSPEEVQTFTLGRLGGGAAFVSKWIGTITGAHPLLQIGVWHHVAATLEAANLYRLYVDGVETGSGYMHQTDTPAGTSFYLGRQKDPYGDTRRLQGMVDEITVYNRTLSPAEIRAIYQAGSSGKGATSSLAVTGSAPRIGARLPARPTDFTIDFSQPLEPMTVQAGDLVVNGVPATSFTMVDADTVTFRYATTPTTAAGPQTMSLAAGALHAASGNPPHPLAAWVGTVNMNAAPQAGNDNYSMPKNAGRYLGPPGVLINDRDANGDPLTAVKRTDPASGALTLNSDGSFVYIPATDFTGSVSFTYEVSDGQLQSEIATVTITVLPIAGEPREAFGANGIVITTMSDQVDPAQRAIHDAVLQPDGKIVVAGNVGPARYSPDGTLDGSFNAAGSPPGTLATSGAGWFTSVALQADGKIVVAGIAGDGLQFMGNMVVMRYHANGTLDTTFGQNGRVVTSFSDFPERDGAWAVGIQPWDQKIVVVGHGGAIARYLPSGALDSAFDADGKLTISFNEVRSIGFQPDRKIVVAGTVVKFGGEGDFGVARLNENGALDTTFGNQGLAFTDFGSVVAQPSTNDGARAMVVQPNGKILVAGGAGSSFDYLAMSRLNPDGLLDASFGEGGKLLYRETGTRYFHGLALQPDGKIIAIAGPELQAIAVYRFTSSGVRDTTFNAGGKGFSNEPTDGAHYFHFRAPDVSSAYDVLTQPDGKILIVGHSGDKYALARLKTEGTLDGLAIIVAAEDGAQSIENWAQKLFPEVPPDGVFAVTNDNTALFQAQPAMDSLGTLRFTPAPNSQGIATVTVVLTGSSGEGEAGGHVDTNLTKTFTIEILQREPWQNDKNPVDANDDGYVAPDDILLVIDYINGYGSGPAGLDSSGPYYDTSGDSFVSPLDALMVINVYNSEGDEWRAAAAAASAGTEEGEGEGVGGQETGVRGQGSGSALEVELLAMLALDQSGLGTRKRR